MFFKTKSEIDESLNLYYEEEKEKREKELDMIILESELKLKIRGAEERAEFEHEYHQDKEDKKSVLARLEAEIDFKDRLVRHYEVLLAEKDKTIVVLKDIIFKLLNNKMEDKKIDV
jgi:hypothetical protein